MLHLWIVLLWAPWLWCQGNSSTSYLSWDTSLEATSEFINVGSPDSDPGSSPISKETGVATMGMSSAEYSVLTPVQGPATQSPPSGSPPPLTNLASPNLTPSPSPSQPPPSQSWKSSSTTQTPPPELSPSKPTLAPTQLPQSQQPPAPTHPPPSTSQPPPSTSQPPPSSSQPPPSSSQPLPSTSQPPPSSSQPPPSSSQPPPSTSQPPPSTSQPPPSSSQPPPSSSQPPPSSSQPPPSSSQPPPSSSQPPPSSSQPLPFKLTPTSAQVFSSIAKTTKKTFDGHPRSQPTQMAPIGREQTTQTLVLSSHSTGKSRVPDLPGTNNMAPGKPSQNDEGYKQRRKMVVLVFSCSCAVVALSGLVCVGRYFWKKQRHKKKQMNLSNWAGQSPFLDTEGEMENCKLVHQGDTRRVSFISILPYPLSKESRSIEELQLIEASSMGVTFGKHGMGELKPDQAANGSLPLSGADQPPGQSNPAEGEELAEAPAGEETAAQGGKPKAAEDTMAEGVSEQPPQEVECPAPTQAPEDQPSPPT